MPFLRKYATATTLYFPLIKRGVVDFALSADYTPTAGDCKISIDGAAAANTTNLPSAITMGNGAMWSLALTTGETTGKKIAITIVDAATKAVEDQMLDVLTYGNASAELQQDLSAAKYAATMGSGDYTGNTPQTGDAYAVVNDATFGNAKLVRSTTPANTLSVDASHAVTYNNAAPPSAAAIAAAVMSDVTDTVGADVVSILGIVSNATYGNSALHTQIAAIPTNPLTTLGTNAPAGWLNAAAFAAGAIGVTTFSTAAWGLLLNEITVTGSTTPATNDTYIPIDYHQGRRYYQSTTLGTPIYLWWDGNSVWTLSTAVGVNGSAYFARTATMPDGTYNTGGTATGQPLAAESGGAILADNQYHPTFEMLDVTGTLTLHDGLVVSRSSINADAVTLSGNGSGRGLVVAAGGFAGVDAIVLTPGSGGLGINGTLGVVNTLTNAPPDSAGVTTLLARVTSTLFSGITSLKQWLGLLAGKQTGDATALSELHGTGAGSGTYDPTTASLEAIRARGDAAWTTATGFATATQGTAIQTTTDKLATMLQGAGPYAYTAAALANAPSGGGGSVTVAGYAAGQDPASLVLDALTSAHNTAGTIGHAIGAAGTASDPWGGIITATQAGTFMRGIAAAALGNRTSNPSGSSESFTDADNHNTVRIVSANSARPTSGTATTRSVTLN